MDLYIYYKVKDADAASLQAAVVSMQAALGQRHGVVGRLKRRPDTKDGVQTWMEVYESTPEGFAAMLDSAVHEAGVLEWIAGLRHTEVFLDVVPPCA
jgi:tartrate dehydratase beta subunit/fumarate hydratase class I family protein